MNAGLRILLCLIFCSVACSTPEDSTPPGRTAGSLENTDKLCSDGIDNDGDGYLDCADTDCTNSVAVTLCNVDAEASADLCGDGQDNDGDGLVDCADPECETFGCNEASDEYCADGIDNDGDNWVDCEDFSCKYGCEVTVCNSEINPENSQEECGDGIDNDSDGKVDCDDRGCQECNEECQGGLGENSLTLCTDGIDNDGDGAADCQDTECIRVEGIEGCDTGEENTAELCSDGIDNDNDPYIDCADRHCEGLGACVENTAEACSDGVDNDGDGYADCQDFDCSGLGACGESTDDECQDGLDNDGNGYTDCEDFGCLYGCDVTVCPGAEKSEAECFDNIDNDNDNHLDCADMGCQQCVPACSQDTGENTLELCGDGQDNDSDGVADCLDTECTPFFDDLVACDTGETDCADGLDNDNDPYVDCADRDCRADAACAENTDERCSDNIDNDGDGFLDCVDHDCSLTATVTVCGDAAVENTDAACADSQDNDNDGNTDCDDYDCYGNPALTVCPAPTDASIRQLQDDATDGAIVLGEGEFRRRVRLSSVVVTSSLLTGRDGKYHFFVQETFPPSDVSFSGIQVFAGNTAADIEAGDVINLVGFYQEHYGLSQIHYGFHEEVATGSVVSALLVNTLELSTEGEREAYEGVLVEFQSVRVTEIGVESRGGTSPESNDFSIVEASVSGALNPMIVSTEYHSLSPEVDDEYSAVKGPLTYSWSQYRLVPRTGGDVLVGGEVSEDDDSDGLSNAEELALGTSIAIADTDGDGVADLAEVVDVAAPKDSDCDGKIDAVESSILDGDGDGVMDEVDSKDMDGPAADPDSDGVPNSEDSNDDGDDFCDPGIASTEGLDCTQLNDNCSTIANDDQGNADNDSEGDACDIDVDGDGWFNPGVCESDLGGSVQVNDNCPASANSDQADLDEDGVGDACDPDLDGDGVCQDAVAVSGVCEVPEGLADNCPAIANSTQANNDADNPGDACDPDDDNDGVCDPGVQEGEEGCAYVNGLPDNCPFTTNPIQEDTNADLVGDACTVTIPTPGPGDILINEILLDPHGAGDANGDGDESSTQDEFIELINISGGELDLKDCTVSDANAVRHAMTLGADPQAYVLQNHQGLVIFSGGNPVGTFGNSKVVTSSTGQLQLNNSGDTVTLTCGASVIDLHTVSNTVADQSVTRQSDGSAASQFVPHTDINPAMKFSPGTCVDGIPFSVCLD